MTRPGLPRLLPLVAGLSTSALAVVINLWTDLVPDAWTSWPPYPWLVASGVFLLTVGAAWLTGRLQSPDQGAAASSGQAIRKITGGVVIGTNSAPYVHAPGGVVHLHSAAASQASTSTSGPISNLPHPSSFFTGRERYLRLVRTRLAQTSVKVIAIHGLAGVGKTQLALEFARRWLDTEQPSITWWIRAEEPMTAIEDLAALASTLGLPQSMDHSQSMRRLHAELLRRPDWLLIFDNAATPVRLKDWLPGGCGVVVITSRNRGWGDIASQIKLSPFSRTESLTYLRRRVERYDREHAEELAQQVGYLPLALAQAAGYIDARDLAIDDYLHKLCDPDLAGKLFEGQVAGYGTAMAKAWLLQYDYLSARCPAGLDLLRLCSFLAPDDIDLEDLLSDTNLAPSVRLAGGGTLERESAF